MMFLFLLFTQALSFQIPFLYNTDNSKHEHSKLVRFVTNELLNLNADFNSSFIKNNFDVWEFNDEFTDLVIEPDNAAMLDGLNHTVLITDLLAKIKETFPASASNDNEDEINIFKKNHEIFFNDYRRLHTIYSWFDLLQETYPELMYVETIGETYNKNEFKLVHLSANNNGFNPSKKTILITGGIHAREWISISTCLYIIYELLTKNSNNHNNKNNYLNHFQFIIIPVLNPDGYEFTWESDRLWRKNRQPTSIESCFGIDIDHSFSYHWNNFENYPCSENFNGDFPLESLESQIIQHYLNTSITSNYNIVGFLDLHSYSQKVLYPYSHSCQDLPKDLENLLELAYGMSKSIRLKNGKNYNVLSACQDNGVDLLPGLGGGTLLDFMYHNKARYAFQIKLRDTGSHGFLLPSSYILPVGEEVYSAVKYFCEFLINPGN